MSETFICYHCHESYPMSQCTIFDGCNLCPTCFREQTFVCQDCGTRLWANNNVGNISHPLCQSCYNEHYTTCDRCGGIVHDDDVCYMDSDPFHDYPYCEDCYHSLIRDDYIHDYSYKPDPIFYGEGTRFMGVELEIDGAGEKDANAAQIIQIANFKPHIYCKHDGSLRDGFEIVTHPMTLPYHQDKMPWEDVLKEAVQLGYRSHQAGTCGLHIHVNRNSFGKYDFQQDAAIARVLYFFEKHWEELLKFSRRTQRQLDRWAARYGYKDQPSELLEQAKLSYHAGRYACVNLQNTETIEFRMFRGTLKYNTLIAALQLVDRICDAAISMSDDEIKAMSWTTFAAGCTQPELIQYLKERRLYVNDAVETEAEI